MKKVNIIFILLFFSCDKQNEGYQSLSETDEGTGTIEIPQIKELNENPTKKKPISKESKKDIKVSKFDIDTFTIPKVITNSETINKTGNITSSIKSENTSENKKDIKDKTPFLNRRSSRSSKRTKFKKKKTKKINKNKNKSSDLWLIGAGVLGIAAYYGAWIGGGFAIGGPAGAFAGLVIGTMVLGIFSGGGAGMTF